jgi:hypothetical protein
MQLVVIVTRYNPPKSQSCAIGGNDLYYESSNCRSGVDIRSHAWENVDIR